jgi:hypothetical protein
MIFKILYWLFLFIPLSVIGLPNWQTTLTEDVLLLGSTVFLILRWADDKRNMWNDSASILCNALFVALIYGILWLGFVRGYYEEYGKLIALFPLSLILALWMDPYPKREPSQSYQQISKTLLILNILVFIMLLFWGRITHREANLYYQTTKYTIAPMLTVLPILSLAFLHAKRFPVLNSGRNYYPILVPLTAMLLVAWSGNAYTWAIWYTAGKMEREWTTFQYDKTSQPELYAAAEHKPLDAVKYYAQVQQRLKTKGEIPQYWNWDFLMQYRMAYQARRLKNASKCLAWLPPQRAKSPQQIKMLQDLWDTEFITDMMHNTDMFDSPHSLFIDFEMSYGFTTFDPINAYVMDCFGRVYEYKDEQVKFVWAPREMVNNAVDLEVLSKDSFAVLTEKGNVIFTNPLFKYFMYDYYVKQVHFSVPVGQKIVDMERLPMGLIAITDYGELLFEGKIPNTIPQDQAFHFGRAVVADLEIATDQKGLYVLDIYGGVHSNVSEGNPIPHTSPPVDPMFIPYWLHQNMAVDLELDPRERGLYIYTRLGEIFTVAVQPYRETYRPTESYPLRGIGLIATESGLHRDQLNVLYALESNGNIIKIP